MEDMQFDQSIDHTSIHDKMSRIHYHYCLLILSCIHYNCQPPMHGTYDYNALIFNEIVKLYVWFVYVLFHIEDVRSYRTKIF